MVRAPFGEIFMPHGMCYLWKPELLWLHVSADLLTGLAYWTIPPFLLLLVLRSRGVAEEAGGGGGLPFPSLFIAFGVFIVACGATHFMAVWTVWEPVYWIAGSVKALTAVASVATAVALPPLIPKAVNLVRDARASERRRQELEAAHADLRAAHEELADLYERVRAADRVKTDFFANVSHELRTPVSLILGPIEQLSGEPHLTERDRERLRTVRRNAHALLGYVDNLLDVARLEERQMGVRWADVDLPGLVRGVAAQFDEHARAHGIAFVVETPDLLSIQADPAKVERILANLVSNAFRFTPDGGRVRCTVLQSQKPEAGGRGEVVVEVADSGAGIPEHRRAEAFARFRQVGEGTPAGRGSGLGLSIAQEFAHMQGGGIEIGDAPEGGALLTVRLAQLAPEGAAVETSDGPASGGRAVLEASALTRPAPAPRRPSSAQTTRAKVLVVEDHVELAAWVAEVLEPEHAVATAANGAEGLRIASEWKPDLILTDLMMPVMTGEAMVAALREDPALADIPVMILSARPDHALRTDLLRRGALDYVEKPVQAAELAARVRNLVALTRSRALLQEDLATTEQDLHALVEASTSRRRVLERTLAEKQVLLRELHHRVQGNLQTITSLLGLQLHAVRDESARSALRETRSRVSALAMLHELLYRTGDPGSVSLLAYLRSLVRQTGRTYGVDSARVRIIVDGADVVLDADRAIAAGLIAHELVSNALRHAFPEDRSGTLEVVLEETGDRGVRLRVRDDGVGMPPHAGSHPSMGLELVRSLAAQLGARVDFVASGRGTHVTVAIPTSERRTEAGA